MEKLPQNCIIINSVVYALVDDFEPGECDRCHIHEQCTKISSVPCYVLDDEPDNKRFEKVGEITMPSFFITVDDIAQMMERKNERKVGKPTPDNKVTNKNLTNL